MSDPTRLRQILTNLIGNAIKFTEKGSVLVKVQENGSPSAENKSMLSIQVIDTGIGISPEASLSIFDEFMQADPSVSRKYG